MTSRNTVKSCFILILFTALSTSVVLLLNALAKEMLAASALPRKHRVGRDIDANPSKKQALVAGSIVIYHGLL